MNPLRLRLLASLCCLLSAAGSVAQAPPSPAPGREPTPFLLGGIQTHETDHQRWVAALHRAGMNAVQVTVYAHQGPWNTAKLWYDTDQPSVLDEIRAARQNGLQVVLILRVALDHNEPDNRFLWHGLIYPESEPATKDWFRIYGELVLKWARIAEQEGIAVLGIASEMNSLTATLPVKEIPHLPAYYLDDASQERLRNLVGRSEHLFSEDIRVGMGAGDFLSLDDFLRQRNAAERNWATVYTFDGADDAVAAMNRRRQLLDAQWRQLIRRVRQVYSGRLTLAANFDNFHEVSFWDSLDLIGINAYFPLRATLETPLSEGGLTEAWRQIFNDIQAFKSAHDLPQEVLFTELGYTRRRGVTVAPWSSKGFIPLWDPEGEVDRDRAFFWAAQPLEPAERALALQALHQMWTEGDSGLAGILYWKLSSVIDLQRFEPFMLYLGSRGGDPSLPALKRFAKGIRPLSPFHLDNDAYRQAVDAILRDDLAALTRLPPVDAEPPSDGRTPLLHLAVGLGRGDLVRHLLAKGARRDQRDAAGFLPLHWACYQDDADFVALLLPLELRPPELRPSELRPTDGDTWLDHRGETPLMKCARLDNTALAQQLLERRGDLIQARNGLGHSALHLAADQASVTMVAALMRAGGEVDSPDHAGLTPLHLGARRGDLEVMKLLAGDSKGSPNSEKNRPVAEAAIHGRDEVFHLLFAPPTAHEINVYGQSLLHLAAHGGNLAILETLLEHFSNVDPQDDEGWTPLAFATRNGQPEAVALLLAHGASIEHRNKQGTSVLHLAGGSYEPQLLQHFVQHDVDIDLADGDGNTALHHAAGWGYVENIRLLLAAGAEVSRRNNDGDTPLDLAVRSARRRAAELLRGAMAASSSLD